MKGGEEYPEQEVDTPNACSGREKKFLPRGAELKGYICSREGKNQEPLREWPKSGFVRASIRGRNDSNFSSREKTISGGRLGRSTLTKSGLPMPKISGG